MNENYNKTEVDEVNKMDLVNYMASKTALPPQNHENSSNPNSLAEIIKDFPLIEIKEVKFNSKLLV